MQTKRETKHGTKCETKCETKLETPWKKQKRWNRAWDQIWSTVWNKVLKEMLNKVSSKVWNESKWDQTRPLPPSPQSSYTILVGFIGYVLPVNRLGQHYMWTSLLCLKDLEQREGTMQIATMDEMRRQTRARAHIAHAHPYLHLGMPLLRYIW